MLWLAVPAVVLLLWIESRSLHPLSGVRKRLLLVVRVVGVLLLLLALASPARVVKSSRRAGIILLDQSASMGGESALEAIKRGAAVCAANPGITWQTVAVGAEPLLLEGGPRLAPAEWLARNGDQTNYARGLHFASGLFPAGTSRDVVLIGDGHQTQGSLLAAAQQSASVGVTLHGVPLAGTRKPDARVQSLVTSRARIHEGAALKISAWVESTVDGAGSLRLFENGLEVEKRAVSLKAGCALEASFQRTPAERGAYRYRAVIEGFKGDTMPGNDAALAIVEVRGGLRLLFCEGERTEASYLMDAMMREGIKLDLRGANEFPNSLTEISSYDGIILSDVSARALGDTPMLAIREYVEKLGGGLIMIGGPSSFGLGGYLGSPLEEVLPVRLNAPDEEEKQSSALAIVMDRSGSMAGEKLETAKSAAVAAADVLGRNDSIAVYAFDSEAHVVAPLTRVTSMASIRAQIAALASGGGTNLEPAFRLARDALNKARAKIKHIIVLTDGQTSGSGYEVLASQCRAEGITVSTVAIGEGSHVGLLQAIASAGGGQAYQAADGSGLTRIFTEDTLMHAGQLLKEEPTEVRLTERSAMLAGLEKWDAPPLLGYVKTLRKKSAQLPLITDSGDPLLAHWRYGLGKVTAFTSDAKSRWASLWISRWAGYGTLWSQVLRETARPPEGQRADLRCTMNGDEARVTVDVLEDAATRANGLGVQAEAFFVPADTLGAPLRSVKKFALRQEGPGEYSGRFRPDLPGVYMVRAVAGAESISAGLVHQPSGEASLGTVNDLLLRQAAESTGGVVLGPNDELPPTKGNAVSEFRELWPLLAQLFLALWMVDIVIRRWEHVLALADRRPILQERPR